MSWLSRHRHSVSVRGPMARTADLLVEEFGDELLIYDQRSDQAHCLTSAASRVWRACDGGTTEEQLAVALNTDPATIVRALEELEACGLLDNGPASGVTRREATARIAKIGAAAASAPLIYSIAAPTPAMAVTPGTCARATCIQSAGTSGPCSTGCVTGCACCRLTGCAAPSASWALCLSACTTCTQANVTTLITQCNAAGGTAVNCNNAMNCSTV